MHTIRFKLTRHVKLYRIGTYRFDSRHNVKLCEMITNHWILSCLVLKYIDILGISFSVIYFTPATAKIYNSKEHLLNPLTTGRKTHLYRPHQTNGPSQDQQADQLFFYKYCNFHVIRFSVFFYPMDIFFLSRGMHPSALLNGWFTNTYI